MVDRVLATGASRIHLVPTHYYSQDSRSRDITGYCFMDARYQACRSFDSAGIDSFRTGVAMCVAYAARAGARSVAVTPRVDKKGESGDSWSIRSWRNGVIFSPTKKYGGYSYADVMLTPLIDAFAQLPAWMPVHFSLQGEMGATVFRYPLIWRSLLADVRNRLEAARSKQAEGVVSAQSGTGPVRTGLTFNFVYVDGNASPNNQVAARSSFGIFGLVFANTLASRYLGMSGGDSSALAFDKGAVRELFFDSNLHFVGVSAYAPLEVCM
ncbi:hypothetical protein FOA52_001742 [Chlamydomonas sp. UWO 241]|nr:hypothetical protein FOA52_001742 [Chlamydomonas sp. UWO 241]